MTRQQDSADPVVARAREMYAQDQACRSLGIELTAVALGSARVAMKVTEEMTNGHGTAHGGFLFLLADAAFAYACNSHGPVTVAQAAQIAFLRPVQVGDLLEAHAVERFRRGLTGIYDVTVLRLPAESDDSREPGAEGEPGAGGQRPAGGEAKPGTGDAKAGAGDAQAGAEIVAEFRGHSATLTRGPARR